MEWNQQERGRNTTRTDMREKDGGQGDAQLEIKVSNEGEFPRSLEDLTDDDVFNELINIVVDVFSHKSEKCMLTFELPLQSHIKTISTDHLSGSALEPLNGRVEDTRYVSDISIPIASSESSIVSRCSSKHERSLKLPIYKPARRNFKKIFDKKLNPVVQTVLNAKQGFTDLESLFKFRHQSSSYKQWDQDKRNTNQREEVEPIEQSTFSERPVIGEIRSDGEETNITEEKCDLQLSHSHPTENPSSGDCLRAAGKSGLQRELADVLDSLKILIRTGDESLSIDSHRIDYHVTEMKSHLFAIKSYLCSSASELSSFGETTETNLESKKVYIPRSKRRPCVVLCRMASSQSHQCKRKKPKDAKTSKRIDVVVPGVKKKKTMEHKLYQDDLLRGYNRIKKEETRLVKLLLDRLGLADKIKEGNLIHGKVHKQHNKSRGVHARSQSSELCRSRGSEDFTHQLSPINVEDNKLKRMESSEVLSRNRQKMMKHKEVHQNKADKSCQRKGRRLLRRSLVNVSESRSTTRRFQRDELSVLHPSPKQQDQDQLNSHSESNLPDSGHVGEDLYEQIQSLNDGCLALLPFREEEDVMWRIRNAAERLEHMQSLVEEKLNYLCIKKQLYRELKSMVLKCQARQDMVATGDEIMIEKQELRFQEQSYESGYPSTSSQVSTAIDHFPSIIQIAYSNLEECQDFRDLIKDFVGVSGMAHLPQPKDSKVKLYQNQGTQHVEMEESGLQGITSKSYICNYMMEIRDCDSMDGTCPNQMVHGAGGSVKILSENDKTNALEDGKYKHRIIQGETEKSTIRKPNLLTKGDGPLENDARNDESTLAFEENRLAFHKDVVNVQKRKRRRLISRKTWCTQS